jgi:hypothetical protein
MQGLYPVELHPPRAFNPLVNSEHWQENSGIFEKILTRFSCPLRTTMYRFMPLRTALCRNPPRQLMTT